ncbi:MAG: SsrA-binding protein SmpB [Pseudomonadota bacterium]
MAKAKGKPKKSGNTTIAQNKRARHDYFLENKFEAGVALMGWEVKSIRDGRVQLTDAFITLHQGEAYLASANITPLAHASTHVIAEPQRLRKLLLHARELSQIFVATQQQGYTCVPTALYWKGNKVKCEIALGKGKKQHDKRASTRDKDWQRDKERLMKHTHR